MDDPKPSETPNENPNTNSQPEPTAVTSEPQAITVSTSDTAPVTSEPDLAQPTPTPVTSQPAKKRGKGILVSLLVLVLIAALAVGGYFVTRPQKSSLSVTKVTVKHDIAVLKVADLSSTPAVFYPDIENNGDQQALNMQSFEALTKFENVTSLKPSLAKSWTNPDINTWVFTLQPKVYFHTDKLMTATDVKASIDAAMITDYGKNYTSSIKEVTVVDANTVKITTSTPDPVLANELSNIYIYDTTSTKKNDTINGTGPYVLKSADKTGMVFTAFDKYWGGHIYTRELDILSYQDSKDVPTSLITGKQLGVTDSNSDPAYVKLLTINGYSHASLPIYEATIISFNTMTPNSPLSNVKVRKALAQSFNYKEYIVADGSIGAEQATQPIAKGIPGYNPNIPATNYDAAAAKSALAAAGYPNGFTIKYTYFAGQQAQAEVVKKDFAAVGVTVQLDPQTDQKKFVDAVFGGKTDMFLVSLSSSYADGADVINFYQDAAYYSSDTFNKLYDQAAQELDQGKRVKLLEQAEKVLSDDQVGIPVIDTAPTVSYFLPNVAFTHDFSTSNLGTYFWQTYSKN